MFFVITKVEYGAFYLSTFETKEELEQEINDCYLNPQFRVFEDGDTEDLSTWDDGDSFIIEGKPRIPKSETATVTTWKL